MKYRYRCGRCRGTTNADCPRCEGTGEIESQYEANISDYEIVLPYMLWEVRDWRQQRLSAEALQEPAWRVYWLLVSIGMGEEELQYPSNVIPAARGYLMNKLGLSEWAVRTALMFLQEEGWIMGVRFDQITRRRLREWLSRVYLDKGREPPKIVRIPLWPGQTPEQEYEAFVEEVEA